jgi:hypothetical protein
LNDRFSLGLEFSPSGVCRPNVRQNDDQEDVHRSEG